MQDSMGGLVSGMVEHWACLLTIAGLGVTVLALQRKLRQQAEERGRERRMREEMETYTRLDADFELNHSTLDDGPEQARLLARRVCRTVSEMSPFRRVAMILRDPAGKLYCAASCGIDDLTVKALRRWSEQVTLEENSGDPVRSLTTGIGLEAGSVKIGQKSYALQLGAWEEFDAEVSVWQREGHEERRRFRRAIATPMRMRTGRISGVIVVCGELSRQDRPMGIERAMAPLEMLAVKVGAALENASMAERLLRAEKLAALGRMAAGVAHALNNPLTAVLGFGEHISEMASELSVRKDAKVIVVEAIRMRDTVERLIEFWQPGRLSDEPVEVAPLLRELADQCKATLERRGVRLILTTSGLAPAIRGSRQRLRQVLEHLLNNAAQAISTAPAPHDEASHAIRLTLSRDERGVHIIVSDTGPGFEDPSHAFDPFYTTNQVNEGSGMGLSICYGIIHEHGGEISAFNLHPHGAAVVIELPIRPVVETEEEDRVLVREVA